jgi:NAD(P)-dependent dehydrogenase (short-subunit alcohol dehydrogenase family)
MARHSAIVTGGTGGLGTAVVEALIDAGWQVVVPWVAEKELSRLPEREGLTLVRADLFDPADVAGVVSAATGDASAPLDAVVNLVGGFASGGRVHETPIDEFERQFALNLRPTYLVTAAALPHLIETGSSAVVCVSTRAALRPFSGAAGYISSKAAVLGLVRALDAEYRNDGVRVNAILPSVIDTPGNRTSQPDADHSKWVKPAEIAAVIRFLCSEDASPITGGEIPVYGRA